MTWPNIFICLRSRLDVVAFGCLLGAVSELWAALSSVAVPLALLCCGKGRSQNALLCSLWFLASLPFCCWLPLARAGSI